jgi:hypothetical protein
MFRLVPPHDRGRRSPAGEFTVIDPFPGGASIFYGVVVTDGDNGITSRSA